MFYQCTTVQIRIYEQKTVNKYDKYIFRFFVNTSKMYEYSRMENMTITAMFKYSNTQTHTPETL